MWLDLPTFNTVVASTPLVAIDLVVMKPGGETLLGLRVNRPAYGFWFVPGGRVQKNESLDSAFRRLTQEELGARLNATPRVFSGCSNTSTTTAYLVTPAPGRTPIMWCSVIA